MNEEMKSQWLPILESTKLNPTYYDKVLGYIESYLVNESLYGHMIYQTVSPDDYVSLRERILFLSLSIFNNIDLDKVDFVYYPMNDLDNYLVKTSTYSDVTITNEISQTIQKELDNGNRVTIYRIVQDIFESKTDGSVKVYSRLKFHK